MGFAEEKFLKYLRENLTLLESININEMLNHLAGCLTKATVERLKRNVNNEGNSNTLFDFVNDLSKRDDWVNHLIRALRCCELDGLADHFQGIYYSYRALSSPHSLSPSATGQQPPPYQPYNEQRNPSLPPQPHLPPDPQPGTSQRFNQNQNEQETARSRPSPNQPQESSAVPGTAPPCFPPSQRRVPLSDSPPTPLSRKTSEGKTTRVPVPETEPFQDAPPEDSDASEMVTLEETISRNPPRGNQSMSPSLEDIIPQATSRQETSQDLSAAQVTPAQQSSSLPAGNEEWAADLGGQPAYHKAAEPPEPFVSPSDSRHEQRRGDQSVYAETAKPPETRLPAPHAVWKDVAESERHRNQAVYREAPKPPEPRSSGAISNSSRMAAGDDQRRDQSVYGEAAEPPELLVSPSDSHSAGNGVRHEQRRGDQSVYEETAKPPETRLPAPHAVWKDVAESERHSNQAVYREAPKPPESHSSGVISNSSRMAAGDDQRRDRSVYGEVDDSGNGSLSSPPVDHRLGVGESSSPKSREPSVHQPATNDAAISIKVNESSGLASPPADHRVHANEAVAASRHREQHLHQRETTSNVVPFSPSRRLDNDEGAEEWCLTKPEVLRSTFGVDNITGEEEQASVFETPDFQISDSDSEEGSVSRGPSDQTRPSPTSPPSDTRTSTTVTTKTETPQTSTPNRHITWRNARKSPEENDFTYSSTTNPTLHSPGYTTTPGDNLPQQPEENSFELSQDISSYRIEFNEESTVNLNEGNDSVPRHRWPTTPDNSELNDRNKYQKISKTEKVTKLEVPVIITLAVAALGLSLILLWKKQRT